MRAKDFFTAQSAIPTRRCKLLRASLHCHRFYTDNVKNLGEVFQFDDETNLDAKVWDIFLLLPSFVFLVILGYCSPRTRQQVKLSIDRIETMLVVEKSWRTDHGCDYSSTFQLAKAPSILPKTLHLLILTGGVGFCFLSEQNFLAIS